MMWVVVWVVRRDHCGSGGELFWSFVFLSHIIARPCFPAPPPQPALTSCPVVPSICVCFVLLRYRCAGLPFLGQGVWAAP